MILALDLGSTYFKAALFDSGLHRLSEEEIPTPYSRRHGAIVEMEPEETWSAVMGVMRMAVSEAGAKSSDVRAVAVTSQAQTFCISDGEGRARTPFISWLDTRARVEAEEIRARFGSVFHRHCSFPQATAQLQVCQIRRLVKGDASLLADGARVMSLPCYVFNRLAGEWISDSNLGAMSGVYSLLEHGSWGEMLEFCRIPPEAVPTWVPVGGGIDSHALCPDWGEKSPLRLVCAGNDQTAGAFGAGCSPSDVLVTLGTALVAYRTVTGRVGPYSGGGCWGPYPGGGYYELAYRDEGCLALDFARDHLMPGLLIEDFFKAAESEADQAERCGWFFFPDLIRSGEPWVGEGDRRLLPYATVEGLTFSLRDLVFDELVGELPERILAVGGGARSAFWVKLIADTLNLPVEIVCGDGLLGAASMAVFGTAAPGRRGGEVVFPDSEHVSQLDGRYRRWHEVRKQI